MRFALIGTRGVPAKYGGFETAVEEIGTRLVKSGHEVTVYRRGNPEPRHVWEGIDVVTLPALRKQQLETLSHTFLSVRHARKENFDSAIVFNAANSPFVPGLKRAGIPTAVHVDGLEWKRSKWGKVGRAYYRHAERLSVRVADALIADARGISEYYRAVHSAPTEIIAYGAPLRDRKPEDAKRLSDVRVTPGGYHLVVARFEPENHVLESIEGFVKSASTRPMVVVGGNPYPGPYTQAIESLADQDPRVRLLGSVWDQELLDSLYANCLTYVHGHSVGGTNPSLLRAMGAGAPSIAWDVNFNREVLGETGLFFSSPQDLAQVLDSTERNVQGLGNLGNAGQQRVRTNYNWDDVTSRYEDLLIRLASSGKSK